MMYFDLSDLKDIPLDRTHLVIVVSNLLNNAIESYQICAAIARELSYSASQDVIFRWSGTRR